MLVILPLHYVFFPVNNVRLIIKCLINSTIIITPDDPPAVFSLSFGRGYWPEPFRPIIPYCLELFWPLIPYWPELLRPIITYRTELFRPIIPYWPELLRPIPANKLLLAQQNYKSYGIFVFSSSGEYNWPVLPAGISKTLKKVSVSTTVFLWYI
jgi:hypothetical protein